MELRKIFFLDVKNCQAVGKSFNSLFYNKLCGIILFFFSTLGDVSSDKIKVPGRPKKVKDPVRNIEQSFLEITVLKTDVCLSLNERVGLNT